MNIHKGCVKVLLDRKFALNSPTSGLNSKKKKKRKGKKEENWINQITSRIILLLNVVPLYISFLRFHFAFCSFGFVRWSLILKGLVLHQFRLSLRLFNLSSRFFVRDYVKAVITTLFLFDRFCRFALIRFTFCIGLLDSVFVKEVNMSTLETVIAILIRLCNWTLLYYVNILKLTWISSILFSIYFQWIWQGEFVEQSRVLKLMIISFILVTFLFYSGVIL